MRRRLHGIFWITTALIAVAAPSFAGDVSDEQFQRPKQDTSKIQAYFDDNSQSAGTELSYLAGIERGQDFTIAKAKLCKSESDPDCSQFSSFEYNSYFPFCAVNEIHDCIDSIYATSPTGKMTVFTTMDKNRLEVTKQDSKLIYSSGNFIPKGVGRSIVTMPGVIHKGGTDKYLVDVRMKGEVENRVRSGKGEGWGVWDPTFVASIKPVKLYLGDYSAPQVTISPITQKMEFSEPTPGCALTEAGKCWRAFGFPDEITFGLKLKIATPIYGWIHGRILVDQFSSVKSSGIQMFSISGKPMEVPIAGGAQENSQVNPNMKSTLNLSDGGAYYYTASNGTLALNRFLGLRPLIGDKALASPQQWSLRNIDKKEFVEMGLDAARCIVKFQDIAGYVSTNATAYVSGPPKYNSQEQSLDYRVASPHYKNDGTVTKGFYSLAIRKDIAQCIYGINTLPPSATVSIISEEGIASVATTVSRVTPDWFFLSASNFSYSAPTIRVKFGESTPAAPKTETAISPKDNQVKAVACVKGKTVKKILGTKCPKGYKKK
jgi:hypothetical protein